MLGIFACGTISVWAQTYFPSKDVTYDNITSGLSSNNVQEAIDELYSTCFPPKTTDDILDKIDIITSGDGLYKDEYEDGRYIYRGTNPSNYITFNNEQAGWRIISLESDGTIKIIRSQSIGKQDWDTALQNEWPTATLNTYLNGTYYNSLTVTAQKQITTHYFHVGGILSTSESSIENQLNNEKSLKWTGKIALASPSDYVRANANISQCGTMELIDEIANRTPCKNTNWMFNGGEWWCLSYLPDQETSFSYYVYGVYDYGAVAPTISAGAMRSNVYPVLFLSSSVKITGGDGSQSNPFQIE